MEKMDSKGRTI